MSPDFLDLLRALLGADVRFLVVGAYAVGVHGRPRATKDLDVWVEASAENAPKVINGLIEFGAPLMGLTEADLKTPGVGLQIGVEPGRIDVLTKVSGVRFEDAWPRRVKANFAEGVRCDVIGLEELLQNKRAAGRPQDVADVAALERLHRLKK
jgi:predicted nucleotidyltransferase